jgi:hypothetical protein
MEMFVKTVKTKQQAGGKRAQGGNPSTDLLDKLFNETKINKDKKGKGDDYPNSRRIFLGTTIYNSAQKTFDVTRLHAINAFLTAAPSKDTKKKSADGEEDIGSNADVRYRDSLLALNEYEAQQDQKDVQDMEQQFA